MLRYEDQFTMISVIKSLTPELQDQILKSQDPEAEITLVKSGPGEFEFLQKSKKGKGKDKEAVEHVSSVPPDEDEDRDDSNFGNKSTDETDLDLVKAAIAVLEDYLEKGKPSQVPTQAEVDSGDAPDPGDMAKIMAKKTKPLKKEEREAGEAASTDEQKEQSKRREATHWGVRDRMKDPKNLPKRKEAAKEASEGDFDLVKASVEVLKNFLGEE